MKIVFSTKNAGESVIAEASLVFEDDDPLAGLKLVGFTIWKGDERLKPYVTLPARAFGIGGKRQYFDFIRSAREDQTVAGQRVHEDVTRLKNAILHAWEMEKAGLNKERGTM